MFCHFFCILVCCFVWVFVYVLLLVWYASSSIELFGCDSFCYNYITYGRNKESGCQCGREHVTDGCTLQLAESGKARMSECMFSFLSVEVVEGFSSEEQLIKRKSMI